MGNLWVDGLEQISITGLTGREEKKDVKIYTHLLDGDEDKITITIIIIIIIAIFLTLFTTQSEYLQIIEYNAKTNRALCTKMSINL